MKKYLADGTEAKVNMIVVVMGYNNGNDVDTITKITKINVALMNIDAVACEAIPRYPGDSCFNECTNTKIPSWFEYCDLLRKATAEERKDYYAYKRTQK